MAFLSADLPGFDAAYGNSPVAVDGWGAHHTDEGVRVPVMFVHRKNRKRVMVFRLTHALGEPVERVKVRWHAREAGRYENEVFPYAD